MNLEINIKVPLGGAGVSITEGATANVPISEPSAIPEPMSDLLPPPFEMDVLAPPPHIGELVEESTAPEPTAEPEPPPLLDLDGIDSMVEAAPPSIASLEMWTGAVVSGSSESPPSPEELGLAASLDTVDLEPPAVEELMAMLDDVEGTEKAPAASRSREPRASSGKKPAARRAASKD
jgi:hypothetical protein